MKRILLSIILILCLSSVGWADSFGNLGGGGASYPGVTSDGSNGLTVNGNISLTPNAGVNRTINFGNGYTAEAIVLYDGGASHRFGWGLQATEMQFFLDYSGGAGHFSFNYGGDLQTSGINEIMRITSSGVANSISGASKLLLSFTAPTISSGFGSSPSIAANNGTSAFTVNVGTGGTATNGVIGMPAATTGWICHVNNLTAAAGHVAYNTRQTASTTNTVTVENQTTSTGTAIAWAASNILQLSCFAY